MRVWYFSEMAYHPAWEEGLKRGSLRVVLPSANYDPKIGHQLLNRYLDEFRLCDEVGLDIMVNEHHSTSTCLTVSVPMALAVIARETKRARLLSLGTPIANRPDPVRVAEEMAWLDVLSGGRLEMGLVKGAPYEIAPANSNPANLMRRYWELHDLILKAMSTTDGPFSGCRCRAVHQSAGLQLARRQHRDAQIRREARRLRPRPPGQSGRPADGDDRAAD